LESKAQLTAVKCAIFPVGHSVMRASWKTECG
jgi:hypothetical protein